ncbi:cytochrome P450 [Mycena alexandri]|uniref:Cytochrome P450 n=1 Tax=Mycena alexandri TaxID=1745969 RepID=A0AAD6S1B9_9AGAR|nr:cytochrome P450 [Mycena alexandri]
MIFEGYQKCRSGVFKVPRWSTRWAVIVTGDSLVEEFHKLPDDICSLEEAAKEEMQVPHTMGHQIYSNPYHLSVLRANLNRHTDHLVVEILDEVTVAVDDVIGQHCTDDWAEFNVNEHVTKLVPRIFNRVLVGAPLCRNAKFNELGCRFSLRVYVTSVVINLFPGCFRNIIGGILGQAVSFQMEAARYLQPLIEERMEMMGSSGSYWVDKPNDFLIWLLDEFKNTNFNSADIQSRILTANSATTYTSSYTFMQALLNMASRQECIERCTMEVEECIRCHGWTRNGIDSLASLDSFFKESIRVNGLASMKPFILADGTRLETGSFVSASFAAHFDDEYYPNAKTFDAFRFPGRFLVAYALKALMAHVLLHYDLKIGGDGSRKPDYWFSYHCTPSASATYAHPLLTSAPY